MKKIIKIGETYIDVEKVELVTPIKKALDYYFEIYISGICHDITGEDYEELAKIRDKFLESIGWML